MLKWDCLLGFCLALTFPFHLWAPPGCHGLLLSPLGCRVFLVSGSPPGCLLAQRCFMWQGAHPSAPPACLLPGQARPSPYSSRSRCICAKPPATRRATKTSQSLTGQQRPSSAPSCPPRPQLFSPYSVEAPCVSRQICLLSSKDALLLASEPWLLRFSPRDCLPFSSVHLSLPFMLCSKFTSSRKKGR